jgi:hypothetical protein
MAENLLSWIGTDGEIQLPSLSIGRTKKDIRFGLVHAYAVSLTHGGFRHLTILSTIFLLCCKLIMVRRIKREKNGHLTCLARKSCCRYPVLVRRHSFLFSGIWFLNPFLLLIYSYLVLNKEIIIFTFLCFAQIFMFLWIKQLNWWFAKSQHYKHKLYNS